MRDFINHRESWLETLDSKISIQLQDMMTNDVTIRSLHNIRLNKLETNDDSIFSNSYFSLLVDHGYVTSQLTAIRRLNDRRKNTVSLFRVLQEISSKRQLIRREHYVCFDDVPYDWEAARTLYQCKNPPIPGRTQKIPSTGPMAYTISRRRHEYFDGLSDVDSGNKRRGDLIAESVFAKLRTKLDQVKPAEEVANDFIAHLNIDSQLDQGYRSMPDIRLSALNAAQQALVEVYFFVTSYILLGPSHNLVPIPRFDPMLGYDQVFADDATIDAGKRTREARETEIESWSVSGWRTFTNKM